ncbi:type IV pilin protein [Deinococcus multiflagellatus]|uniref:Type IV pilin protein n=1 Tax=Deinococcus multiflagellatus TaxID=1656887 RepID=A0ABW1ZM00_9DEIO|nr:type II secretion system protein [Deinococcus multiflagellatus]MBZ9716003.1 type II secretion system GspH family protein [Deinococcus multiflagellatus]
MKNTTQGFTLIELLIVIAIIGILAAVLIPNLLGAQKRAYDTSAQSCAKSIQTAQATAQIDNQGYFSIAKSGTAAPTITAGSLPSGATLPTATDLASNCSDQNIRIATTTAPSGSNATYVITVGDIRGSKTFTVTPSNLTGGGNAPS